MKFNLRKAMKLLKRIYKRIFGSAKKKDQLKEFEKSGNTIIGRPRKTHSNFKIYARGSGHTLIFGSNVNLRGVEFYFAADSNGHIEIESQSSVRGTFIVQDPGSRIVIGSGSRFNGKCRLQAAEGKSIQIGKDCLFADARIRTSDMHSIVDTSTGQRLNIAEDVVIEDHVWLAEDVRVYKGVTIGAGSIVGARSTVTSDIPPNTLALGTPARPRKHGVTWNVQRL